jgi:hypothetical protein
MLNFLLNPGTVALMCAFVALCTMFVAFQKGNGIFAIVMLGLAAFGGAEGLTYLVARSSWFLLVIGTLVTAGYLALACYGLFGEKVERSPIKVFMLIFGMMANLTCLVLALPFSMDAPFSQGLRVLFQLATLGVPVYVAVRAWLQNKELRPKQSTKPLPPGAKPSSDSRTKRSPRLIRRLRRVWLPRLKWLGCQLSKVLPKNWKFTKTNQPSASTSAEPEMPHGSSDLSSQADPDGDTSNGTELPEHLYDGLVIGGVPRTGSPGNGSNGDAGPTASVRRLPVDRGPTWRNHPYH